MQAIIPNCPIKRRIMRRKNLEEKLEQLKVVRRDTQDLPRGNDREMRLKALNDEILKIARELEHLDRSR